MKLPIPSRDKKPETPTFPSSDFASNLQAALEAAKKLKKKKGVLAEEIG